MDHTGLPLLACCGALVASFALLYKNTPKRLTADPSAAWFDTSFRKIATEITMSITTLMLPRTCSVTADVRCVTRKFATLRKKATAAEAPMQAHKGAERSRGSHNASRSTRSTHAASRAIEGFDIW